MPNIVGRSNVEPVKLGDAYEVEVNDINTFKVQV